MISGNNEIKLLDNLSRIAKALERIADAADRGGKPKMPEQWTHVLTRMLTENDTESDERDE